MYAKLGQADVFKYCKTGTGLRDINYCKAGSGQCWINIAELGLAGALQNWYQLMIEKHCKTGSGRHVYTLQKWVRPVEQKIFKAL